MAKLYSLLAILSGSIGTGMIFGAQLAKGTSNSPYWVGGILLFLGALTLGMAISSRAISKAPPEPETPKDQQ